MTKCQWRERPSDDPKCPVATDPGQKQCPRHVFMDQLRAQKRRAKEQEALERQAAGTGGLPKSPRDLIARGYVMVGASECSDCRQMVEWWRTPSGRRAPYNQMPHKDAPAVSHFGTCPRAASFRRAG